MRRRQFGKGIAAWFVLAGLLPRHGAFGQAGTPIATPGVQIPTPDPEAGDSGPVRAESPYRLVLLVPFQSGSVLDPYWQDVQTAVVARAAANGVTVDVKTLTAASVPDQLEQIDSAIANEYSGILIGPVDADGVAPGIATANADDIPVIAIDTAPSVGEIVALVRTDNVAATKLAGEFIGQELGGSGKVLNVQGDLGTEVGQDRSQGLQEGLAQFPDISIRSVEGTWQSGSGYSAAISMLPRAGEGTPAPPAPLVDAIFAANPAMTLGAARAVEQTLSDSVRVFGFGATQDTLDAIRNGTLEGVIAEFPSRAGAIAVDLMVRHLNGDRVSARVDSGFTWVTLGNLDEFVATGS